jgi:hypothetical protein
MTRLPLYGVTLYGFAALLAAANPEPCCTVVSLDAKRQTVTAIQRDSAKLFAFTVKNPKVFKSIQVADRFDAPVASMQKDQPFAADVGLAESAAACCTLTTDVGGAGQALGVHPHDQTQVDVVLMELKRTAGTTVTVRWQYLNGGDEPLQFEAKGCTGMGCTYSVAEDMHLLDGATRTKYEVLRDETNKAVAQQYESSKMAVAPHQAFSTWAKFNAPPASSSKVTVVIPGVSEPFEDIPIAP